MWLGCRWGWTNKTATLAVEETNQTTGRAGGTECEEMNQTAGRAGGRMHVF